MCAVLHVQLSSTDSKLGNSSYKELTMRALYVTRFSGCLSKYCTIELESLQDALALPIEGKRVRPEKL
jgi:hypothetical protein